MKPAGFLLLIPAGLAAAASANELRPGLASAEIKAHIREGLPAYAPAPPPPADSPLATENTAATDLNLLILPKFVVREKRLPSDAVDHLMSRQDLTRRWRNRYLDDLARDGALNEWLNSFTLPLLSPSRAEKGAALERGAELDRLAGLLSPEEAKGLNGFYDELAGILGRRAPKRR